MIHPTLLELVRLLRLDTEVSGRTVLRERAKALTFAKSKGQGHLWAAIGLDYVPCEMACAFCSFGKPWTAITEERRLSLEEVEEQAAAFIKAGADYLILRTSECCTLHGLQALAERLRPLIPDGTKLVANTGCQSEAQWRTLRAAGFDGIYKTIRLREGTDTPFNREERLENILSAKRAGLEVFALLEPVGPEHTAQELYEGIVTLRDHIRPTLVGAMARVPVAGSPAEHRGRIDDTYLADLTAIIVLSVLPALAGCGTVCSHPASPALVEAGANAMVVERGAIPRDTRFASHLWSGFTPADVWKLLTSAGYNVPEVFSPISAAGSPHTSAAPARPSPSSAPPCPHP